jgi:hypothetical protein
MMSQSTPETPNDEAAQVDTAAATCSIHCELLEFKDASKSPIDNLGNLVRFRTGPYIATDWFDNQSSRF